jgi:hypothetical protein
LNLVAGDRLFLRSSSAFQGESELRLVAKSKAASSYISGYTLYQLGRKLTELITGDANDFESSLLQNTNIVITSGDGVRSIADAAIKTTWKDFKKACNAYLMTMVQISDKARIEGRAVAFDTTVVHTPLGEVKDVKITPAIDLMATTIKVGHKEQQVDDTNGKFDFNGYQVYKTPVERIPAKELDLTSPWKASPYEIEQTRANYEGKTTTDKDTDNDLFAIATIPNDDYNIREKVAIFYPGSFPLLPEWNQIPIHYARV